MTPIERLPTAPTDVAPVRSVAVVAVHTSPLHQAGTGDGGGLNVYVRETAERLAARGVRVDVFTRDVGEGDPVEVSEGFTVHPVVAGPRAPVAKHRLPNHLCEFYLNLLRHPTIGTHDVVHAHYWLSGWVARRVAARERLPFVQTFHTLAALKNDARSPGEAPEPPLRLAAEQRISEAADRIAVLTCGEARHLHRRFGVPGSRLDVVPAGVDLERFSPGEGAPDEFPEGGPRLLFVGRLQRLKGPDVALRTLAVVRRTHPDAVLLVVGGPSGEEDARTDHADLLELARSLGVADAVRVVPARPQTELAALYRAADVMLVPSRSETFGLVALEAQACGTPVVAADVGGLRAVVNGGGTLVPGHDPEDHGRAVLRYLDDAGTSATAGERGLATARRATWDHTVDRLLEVYADLQAARRAVA